MINNPLEQALFVGALTALAFSCSNRAHLLGDLGELADEDAPALPTARKGVASQRVPVRLRL